MSTKTRDLSPESIRFRKTCARIDSTMQQLQDMGIDGETEGLGMVKTFNGNPKPDPSRNRFAGIHSEGEDDDDEQEQPTRDEVNDSGSGEDDEDHGEFTEVVRKRRSENSTIGKHRVYTEDECKYFSFLYNLWFKCYTGKDLNFIITPESQPFISAFEACLELFHVLSSRFHQRPNWVDPFGGSGGDTCAALFSLYPKAVYVGEYVHTPDSDTQTKQFSVMEHNIGNMRKLFPLLDPEKNPNAPEVHMANETSETFLRKLPLDVPIDILYLDPNWYKGGPLQETERSPKEMMTYLNYHVIKPIKERGVWPKCIVFKTRWLSQVLWPFMKLLTPDYHPYYSIEATPFRTKIDEKKFQEEGEVRGRFHWVVIIHDSLRTIHWKRSEVYTSLFLKNEDVFIEEADLIEPRVPAYADNVLFPKKSIRKSGPGLLHIRPPPRPWKTGTRPKRVSMSKFKSKHKGAV